MAPQSLRSFVEKNLVCSNDTFIYSFEIVHLMVFRVARLFYGRCQAILEVMAKLSYVSPTWSHVYRLSSPRAAERKRRQVYRGEVHGQLPFDPKGMEDAVPSIDFSPSGGKDADSLYTLERTDVSSKL